MKYLVKTECTFTNIWIYPEHKFKESMEKYPKQFMHYRDIFPTKHWYDMNFTGFNSSDEAKVWVYTQRMKKHQSFVLAYERKELHSQDRSNYMREYYKAVYDSARGGVNKTQVFMAKMAERLPELFL